MRVVVTGATGNVGTSVVEALTSDASVSSIVGLARRRPDWSVPKVTWVQADVASDDLAEHFAGADAVVHLAWLIQPSRDPWKLWNANVVGSERVFSAAAHAGVSTLVHASSVGVYSPGLKGQPVDESWPTNGVPTLEYSWHKAYVERVLDTIERDHPAMRIVRLRPGLIFSRRAASEIRRLFVGPLLPPRLVRRSFANALAKVPVRFQAVHSADIGEAYRLALTHDVRGAFNVAADPVLGSADGSRVLGRVARTGVAAAWHLRLVAVSPGWVDLAFQTPIMDTTRAREELGWSPRLSSVEALEELLDGLHDSAGFGTPPLDRHAGGPLRSKEIATGVGAR
jgi:UDP-glucose 4-epimerase